MRRIVLSVLVGLGLTVGATAVSARAATSSFSDVPRSSAFYGDVTWLVGRRITSGYTDGTFRPAGSVSRQEMAKFLYAFAHPGVTAPACTKAAFPDVPASSIFCPQISWLVSHRIAAGYTDGSFRPRARVTRQELAKFLYAEQHDGAAAAGCTSAPFTDVPATSLFCGSISWLVSTGIASGDDGGLYHPTASVVRQEMAAFLHRAAAPAPPASGAHYVRTTNAATLAAAGRADAAADQAAGSGKLHLLDIGAQTVTAPLSAANPGVLLTNTDTRIPYGQLVSLVSSYLQAYAAAGGSGATVAVGTNSEGDFTAYPAASRAADWWSKVVAPLRASAPSGVTVTAANDIEPDFQATPSQAAAWKVTYLSVAASAPSPRLIFNGAASGCPSAYGRSSGACSDGWTEDSIAAVAGGTGVAALPQIYNDAQAVQWANIATGRAVTFLGALTTHTLEPQFNTAQRGWIALWNALVAAGRTPDLPVSAELDALT